MVAAASPALYGNDGVSLPDDAEVESLLEAELDAVVNIGLPAVVTGRTGLVVIERIAAAMQVDLAGGAFVPRHCKVVNQLAVRSSAARERGRARVSIGQLGRYLEIRRAVLPDVDITRMAPAFCSSEAATAAIATVSVVAVGR